MQDTHQTIETRSMKHTTTRRRLGKTSRTCATIALLFSATAAQAGIVCDVEVLAVRFRPKKALVEGKFNVLDGAGNVVAADRIWHLCKTELTDAEVESQAGNPNAYIDRESCYQVLTMLEIASATGKKMSFSFDGSTPSSTAGTATSCSDVATSTNSLHHHLSIAVLLDE